MALIGLLLLAIGLLLYLIIQTHRQSPRLLQTLQNSLQEGIQAANLQNMQNLHQTLNQFFQNNQNVLNNSVSNLTRTLNEAMHLTREGLEKRFEQLSRMTEERLGHIHTRVEQQLTEAFEKTSNVFTDIVTRLALIDDAQKKITSLSENIVSLQDILSDKTARGALGEIQLNTLLRNVLPEGIFSIQHTMSNGARVDCLLHLPQPTGAIAIDSKFPLENYRLSHDKRLSEAEQTAAQQRFRQDIRKHIQDIQTKYIIPGETSDGAIMFIPAEAIFADIHGNYPDLIEIAYKARVWITSPTTLMAILTTARAVLKDVATRQQVDIIQTHLRHLSKDFELFQKRMDNLTRHLQQANVDVTEIHISAKKISQQFHKIEKVDLEAAKLPEDTSP